MEPTEGKRATWMGAEAEYRELRKEIVARIQLRYQLLGGCILLSAAFLGVGLHPDPKARFAALLYPPLAACLAFVWAHAQARLRELSKYVRTHLEPRIPGVGWETYEYHRPPRESVTELGEWSRARHCYGAVFLLTQVLAVVLGCSAVVDASMTDGFNPSMRYLAYVLIVLDVFAVCAVAWFLGSVRRRDQRGTVSFGSRHGCQPMHR